MHSKNIKKLNDHLKGLYKNFNFSGIDKSTMLRCKIYLLEEYETEGDNKLIGLVFSVNSYASLIMSRDNKTCLPTKSSAGIINNNYHGKTIISVQNDNKYSIIFNVDKRYIVQLIISITPIIKLEECYILIDTEHDYLIQ